MKALGVNPDGKQRTEAVEPPSLIDCIMFGNNSLAIARYLEIYPGTEWEDGKRAIYILKKEVFGNKKKKTENVEKTEE